MGPKGFFPLWSVLGMLLTTPALADVPPLILMHWWTSPGESRALSVITAEAERRGIYLDILPQKDHDTLRQRLGDLQRINEKPDFSQWIASRDLEVHVHAQNETAQWPDVISSIEPGLRDVVVFDGKIAAIPVVSHMQNAMFTNVQLLEHHGIGVPKNWDEVIRAFDLLRARGVQPVMASSETWQLRMMMNDFLLGFGGPEAHIELFQGGTSAKLQAALEQSFGLLADIRDDQTAISNGLYWADAATRFAQGESGFFFLGDFAWSEMLGVVRDAEAKIGCQPVPTDTPSLILATDIFLLFPSEDPSRLEQQKAFTEVVLSPEVQRDFVREKGGVPVVSDIEPETLAPCAQTAVALRNEPGAFVSVSPWSFSRASLFHFEQIIALFWETPSLTPAEAAEKLIRKLEKEG